MPRFLSTLAGRVARAAANVLAICLIVLAAHSWPVREQVRVFAAARAAEDTGAPVSIGDLRYNLLTLAFEADDVAGAAPAAAISGGFAQRVEADLAWPALLRGRLELQRVFASGVHLEASSGDGRFAADLRGLSLRMNQAGSGVLAGAVRLEGPASLTVGARAGALTRLDADLAFDGHTLDLFQARLSASGIDVAVAGRIADLSGTARAAMKGTWRGDVPMLCGTWLPAESACAAVRSGTLEGPFTILGELTSPVLDVEGLAGNVVVGTVAPIAVDAKALVSARALEIARLDVDAFGGRVSLHGAVPVGGVPGDSGVTLTWHGIDLGSLSGTVGHAVPLASASDGGATITGDLLRPAALRVEAEASLVPTGAAGVPASGRVTARLDGGQWSMQVADARIGTTSIDGSASGRMSTASIDAWPDASLAGSMVMQTADVHATVDTLRGLGLAAVPLDAVDEWRARAIADIRLDGTLGRPGVSALVQATASRPDDEHALDAQAELRLDPAAIQISSLRASRGGDRVAASLLYQLGSGAIDGEFTGSVPALDTLGELLGAGGWPLRGRADVAGQIAGTTARPLVQAVLHASDLEVTTPALPGVRGAVTPLGDVVVTLAAEDRLDLRAEAPDRGLTASGGLGLEPDHPFDLTMAFQDVDLARLPLAGDVASTVTGRLGGTLAVQGHLARLQDVNADLRMNHVDAVVAGVPVALARPGHVRVEGGRVTAALVDASVSGLAVRLTRTEPRDPLHLSIEGTLPPELSKLPEAPTIAIEAVVDDRRLDVQRASAQWGSTTVKATAQVPVWFFDRWLPRALHPPADERGSPAVANLEIRAIPAAAARWLDPRVPERLDGTIDLVVAAEAAALSPDAVRAEGRLEHGHVEVDDLRLEQDGVATIAVGDGMAALSGWRWTARGTDVTVAARSSLDVAPRYEISVAGALDLPMALAIADERIGGTAQVAMSVSGGPDGLSWDGKVALSDGLWVARGRGLALTDVDATLACSSGGCRVEEFTGQLNGGTLTIEGDLPTPRAPAAARLHAVLRDAGLELPKGIRHDIDADLDLLGGDEPRLTGTLTVWPGTISDSIVGLAGLVSSFQRDDVVETPEEAPSPALPRVGLDVRIETGDNLTFDSHDLQVAATADLRVGGTLAAPQLRGEVATLERGRIFLAGRTWDLETGTISLLEGPRGTETRVAATVTAPISRYVVQIGVSGPASQPTLAMTSDPPLGQSDLAELVLTGTTSGDLGRGGTQQVATLVSTELLTNVGRAVGIDAVRIEQSQSDLSAVDLEPVSRLTISKRLTEKLEIVYSQGLSDSDDLAWVLVLRPDWRGIDMRATIRTNGAEAYELRQELELGAPPRRPAAAQRRRPPPPRISRVDVAGLSAADAAAVDELLSLRAGTEFTTERWQRDRDAVAAYFHDRDRLRARVRASHTLAPDGTYVLTYTIAPGALTRLEVRGYDITRATMATLRDTWSRMVVEELLAEEMADIVRVELAARGHLAAEVATRFRPLPDDGRLAEVEVSPGARTRRRSIEFAGNTAVADGDLRRVIEGRSLEPRCWLSPALLEEPVAALYRARGYMDARVQAARAIAEDRATLTVRIDEGRPFTVGTLVIAGATTLGEAAARTGFGLDAGAPFTADALSGALARLRTAYSRAGYLDAAVESSAVVRHELDAVDVTITVKEGRPSVLREVRVAGREATSANYVARALDVEAGGPVDRVALDEAQQRLYSTGIFRTVDVAVRPVDGIPADAPVGAAEAVVTLEERAEYRVRYGIQFGPSTIESITTANNSSDPGVSFDFQRRNVLGQGIVIGGGGVWSADQHRVRGTASAAMLLGRFVSTTLTVENANQDRTADNGLHVIDRSTRAVLEQRWRYGVARRVEIAYGFDVDRRRVELQATTAEPLPLRARLAGLNATFTYDSRDNRFNPRRGTFHTSRAEAGAGLWLSDIAFGRYQLQHYVYQPVGSLTLASGLRFGSLDVDETQDPASLLLYFKTGGATSVRGYEADSLTPGYLLGLPAGGKVLLVLNEEIRVPITRRIGFVGFADAGNTFTGLDTLALGALKVGAGVGVRFDTPVAVVRFDVARPLWRPPGSPRARWYLSIGQAF